MVLSYLIGKLMGKPGEDFIFFGLFLAKKLVEGHLIFVFIVVTCSVVTYSVIKVWIRRKLY